MNQLEVSAYLVRDYQKIKEQFIQLGKNPNEKTLYHLTTLSAAKRIFLQGFDLKFSKNKALGFGVNLCANFDDAKAYLYKSKQTDQKHVIITCKVIVGEAHGNSSDVTQIVESDGVVYSKPQFLYPKNGYDSMFSENPFQSIWVIPDVKRVLPLSIDFVEG